MTVTDAAPPATTSVRPRVAPPSGLTSGRVLFLSGIGLAWLAALLWTLRSALTDSQGSDSALIFSAQNLFGPVTAALAVGCSAGLAVITAVTHWRSSRSGAELTPALRVALAGASGLLMGVVNGGLTLGLIGDRRISAVYAVCLAAATILGGLLSAIPFPRVLAAGLAGTYATFLVKAVLSPFSGTLAPMFGAEQTLDGANAAGNRMLLAFSLISGLMAGVLAYRGLRQVTEPAIRWPGYMAAGALPGLLALVAEAFTRLSAERLISPITELAVVERTILSLNGNARINASMVLLFAGGLTATVLLGRALKKK
ncbi:MAG: hypothetical protein H0T78_02780 [Longispora sp.]|nr:hypothetical protein [Longispora sp. (in: high G+C Gram-positive bacteria)]